MKRLLWWRMDQLTYVQPAHDAVTSSVLLHLVGLPKGTLPAVIFASSIPSLHTPVRSVVVLAAPGGGGRHL